METEGMSRGKMLESKEKAAGEEGEEEEEGHLIWRVHKRLAVLSHKIC